MTELIRMAYGLLLPVILDLKVDGETARFLDNGGKSLLLGESAEEYGSGKLSPERLKLETLDCWKRFTREARGYAKHLIIAGDADIAAVNRFEAITRQLPSRSEAQSLSSEDLEAIAFDVATTIVEAGVNIVLSPTADIVTGSNAWLAGRTLSDDPEIAARMVQAFVRGAKKAGLMTALKHFPGHPNCKGVPALEPASVNASFEVIQSLWKPFTSGIAAGAEGIMLSPALYPEVIGDTPAPLSPFFPWVLRSRLNFSGLIITCDLDHKSTQGEKEIEDVCIEALIAGADLLLLSPRSFSKVNVIAEKIAQAVESGTLRYERFAQAYDNINRFASKNVVDHVRA